MKSDIYNWRRFNLFFTIIIGTLLTSCSTNKKISYFKDIPDSVFLAARNIQTTTFSELLIQPNDILQVSILTLDPQINNVLSASNTASYTVQPGNSVSPAGTSAIAGYLVDKNGMIELPIIGKISVTGKSLDEIRDAIHEKVSIYYNKPVISVRFANFSITVLGEVAKPATYIIPNEKISILDAIGMAGDLTIYGKRENVLLIRDSLGQKQYTRFDLNSSKMFSSPYFYLRQGDMIYIEPSKSKVAATDASKNRTIALVASGLSLLIIVFSRL
ncbi:MAG: polysaccharide biosynthesis/export family protein [Chitinophagaceae bacterium]